MTWLWFFAALVFIVACVVAAAGCIGEDVIAADHALLLDALWGDDFEEWAAVRHPQCACEKGRVCAWCLGLLRGVSCDER